MTGTHWRGTVLPLSRQRVVPWKNGLGSTRELAIEPAQATVADDFRWRISRATVAVAGPFSPFPGYDRTLWLARGTGLELVIDGHPHRLAAPWQRVDFIGEAAVRCRLPAGPIDDLNVIVRRADTSAATAVLALAPRTPRPCAVTIGTTVIAALDGPIRAFGASLGHGDALRLEVELDQHGELYADQGAVVLIAQFSRR